MFLPIDAAASTADHWSKMALVSIISWHKCLRPGAVVGGVWLLCLHAQACAAAVSESLSFRSAVSRYEVTLIRVTSHTLHELLRDGDHIIYTSSRAWQAHSAYPCAYRLPDDTSACWMAVHPHNSPLSMHSWRPGHRRCCHQVASQAHIRLCRTHLHSLTVCLAASDALLTQPTYCTSLHMLV